MRFLQLDSWMPRPLTESWWNDLWERVNAVRSNLDQKVPERGFEKGNETSEPVAVETQDDQPTVDETVAEEPSLTDETDTGEAVEDAPAAEESLDDTASDETQDEENGSKPVVPEETVSESTTKEPVSEDATEEPAEDEGLPEEASAGDESIDPVAEDVSEPEDDAPKADAMDEAQEPSADDEPATDADSAEDTTAEEPADTVMTSTELEAYFLELVNAERTAKGLAPLATDAELIDAARSHSAWMDEAETFSHTGENGSNPGQRIEAAGYEANGWAENIGYVRGPDAATLDQADVDQLHQALMASDGHRANILSKDLTEIGIGLHLGDLDGQAAIFVTQNFGLPTEAEANEDAAPMADASLLETA